MRTSSVRAALTYTLLMSACTVAQDHSGEQPTSVFAKSNLVAWCIVPFDAKKRTPAARAEMIKRLGMTKVAYDWREEHIPTFEEEIREYQKRGIEFFAFWSWHDSIAPLIEEYQIHPQIWITCPSPSQSSQEQKVVAAAEMLSELVDKARELGLSLGLYNHGGWGGEPENLIAVCEHLRAGGESDHVGIVYNFHHGHTHIDQYAAALDAMQPYLLCLNINGMADSRLVEQDSAKYKILPLSYNFVFFLHLQLK